MPKKKIDLGLRYKNAFGYVAVSQGNSLQQKDFKKKNGLTKETATGNVYATVDRNTSFEELTLRAGAYELFFGDALAEGSTRGKVFAPPPMMSYSRDKTIITTPVDDSDDDPTNDAFVVERYNSGQWDIKIQGLLIDMVNHEFPAYQLKVLRQFFDQNQIVEVEGQWWDALNIKSIYLKSFAPVGVQGFEDTIQFTIQAYSIKPVEFFLKNK
jgi:hypothetical protein